MTPSRITRLLDQLTELKTSIGPHQARTILSLLRRVRRARVQDTESLITLHELLLFLRAYPQSAAIVRETDAQLKAFSRRTISLLDQEVDLSAAEHPEYSGMAGTGLTDTFTYDIVRWLLKRHAAETQLSWEWFESENRLADALPLLMPLIGEDASVEANVPYREWVKVAASKHKELEWLMKSIAEMPGSPDEKARYFNALQLYTTWTPRYPVSRTGLRSERKNIFYHRTPLIARRDLRFRDEVSTPPLKFSKLSVLEGERSLDRARAASTARYRELYGFTHGDPSHVLKFELGRGVDLFVNGLPPERRLPLRAYHSAMMFKNAVPIGYFEGLSIFERMESGFNLYYTFRDGETAWLYARTLSVMRYLTGVSVFSLDPYQVGHENEEGIQSGAFWFYRKLGFRSTETSLRTLTEREEAKLENRKRYRTPAVTLRRLAAAPMIYELFDGTDYEWDNFQLRNVGFAAVRVMQRRFSGSLIQMRDAAEREAIRLISLGRLKAEKQRYVSDLLLVIWLLRKESENWTEKELAALRKIVLAKCSSDETVYLKLMQKHARFRRSILKLGTKSY